MNRAWRGRRVHERRVRAALRKVWRWHESVRRFHPVKSAWLDGRYHQ